MHSLEIVAEKLKTDVADLGAKLAAVESGPTNMAGVNDEHTDNSLISPEKVMITEDDPATKIFDNFLNEVYDQE